jgi:hypothetical protein
MTPDPTASGEPDALVTLDLSSAAPGTRVTRAIVGVLMAIVFGAIAIACAVLYFGYAFIPAVQDWDLLIEWVAPILGVISFGLALLGLEFVRRVRKNAATEPTVFDTAVAVVEAYDPDSTPEPLSATETTARTPPKNPPSSTIV